ncbi:MAG: SprT-like domain-containing protein [Candidatus Thiodiazotropha sp.]
MKSPTHSFYRYLEAAYDHFNKALFNGRLPTCLLTVQREKNVMGYFSANRWTDPQGTVVHEIAVNPAYFARHNLLEVMQTIVHEMVHNWQHCFGKPSRNGYHNKEWAEKMDLIGLIPSSTGRPGGRRTGQKVSDYPRPGGAFERAARAFIRQSKGLPWVDRIAALSPSCQQREKDVDWDEDLADLETDARVEEEQLAALLHCPISELFQDLVPSEQLQLAARKKVKSRYTCPHCRTNVWGKPGLKLVCGECGDAYGEHEAVLRISDLS